MLKIILPVLCCLLFSCHNDFHSPTVDEIKQAVASMYEKRNEAAGGGTWLIKDIKVIRSWKGNDMRHYNAVVLLKGVYTSPPLANQRPDEDFDETREVELIWRDGGWIGVDE